MMTPEQAREHTSGIAETAMIVSSLRLLFRGEYSYMKESGAMDRAYGILEKHGLIDEQGNMNIPVEIWVLVNADLRVVQQ